MLSYWVPEPQYARVCIHREHAKIGLQQLVCEDLQ